MVNICFDLQQITVYLWEYLGAPWVQRLKLIDFTPYGIQSKTRL